MKTILKTTALALALLPTTAFACAEHENVTFRTAMPAGTMANSPARMAQASGHGAHAMPSQPSPAIANGLAITGLWSRATPPGAKVAGGYLTIENKGTAPDRLIGGTSDISVLFEVHEMAMEQGVMRMRALDKGLEIPAGGKVELKPGGYHLMFIDLKRPLAAGETVTGELIFEKAGRVPVTYKIMPIGATGGGHHGH